MKNYIFKNTYDKYNYRYFKSRWILNWMEYTAKMFEQVSVSLFVHWNTILVGIFVPTLQKGRKAFLPICSCSTGLNRVRCLRGNISRWSNISPRWWIWWSQFLTCILCALCGCVRGGCRLRSGWGGGDTILHFRLVSASKQWKIRFRIRACVRMHVSDI